MSLEEYSELKYKVYGIYNKDNHIVYIGRTELSLERRFNSHKKNDGCNKIHNYLYLNKDCYISPLSIHKYSIDMIAEEKRLIKKYKPLCNISCNNDIPYDNKRRENTLKMLKCDINSCNKYFTIFFQEMHYLNL